METIVLAQAAHAIEWLPGVLSGFREFSHAAAPMAVTALWQGIAMALALAFCLRLAPRASAAHRFAVWAAGFAVLAALPFLSVVLRLALVLVFPIHHFGAAASALAPAAVTPLLAFDIRWSFAIAALWLAASIWRATALGIHSVRVRKLWKGAVPVPAASLPQALAWPDRRGLGRHFEVCITREIDRPCVIGFFRPRILIPDWLFARLAQDELVQVVLHEAEHLRRRDDWSNLFQKLCLVLFPLNPALFWIERRLCREREMACDDGVVRVTRAPRAYAACLASVAERGLHRKLSRVFERPVDALSLGAFERRPELARRVHRLLKRRPSLSPWATNTLLAFMGCGLVFASVEFASAPQLVAFVSARPLAVRQLPVALSSAPPQLKAQLKHQIGFQFKNTAYFAGGRSSSARAGFRAVEAVATMPARSSRMRPAFRRAPLRRSAQSSAQILAQARVPATSLQLASSSPQPASEVLTAEDAPEPFPLVQQAQDRHPQAEDSQTEHPQVQHPQDRHPQAEQWIVFTAWQQVETSTGPASSQPVNALSDRTPARITFTQLIFRISASPISVPTFLPVPPIATPFRDGWLVIQL